MMLFNERKQPKFTVGDNVRQIGSARMLTVTTVYPSPLTTWYGCNDGMEYEESTLTLVKRRDEPVNAEYRALMILRENITER